MEESLSLFKIKSQKQHRVDAWRECDTCRDKIYERLPIIPFFMLISNNIFSFSK